MICLSSAAVDLSLIVFLFICLSTLWKKQWKCIMEKKTTSKMQIYSQPSFYSYTDTQHNNKIYYNDSLTGTIPSLKRWQLIRNYARILYLILQETYVLDIC